MRGLWCIQQIAALILLLACISCIPRPVWLLWPGELGFKCFYHWILALFVQSAYILGLAILSMAIAPKLMDALTGKVDLELTVAIGAYRLGFKAF